MGGKTGTTTSSVQIPPEVLARYNSVNAQAQQTAQTPFQQYSTDPNAFVAPLNQQQQAGQAATNAYANAAQPGYQAGYGATNAAMQQLQQGQNVAEPYYQTAQNIAAGTLPQYGAASSAAVAGMTPLQQATYAAQPAYRAAMAGTAGAQAGLGQTIGGLGGIAQGYNAPNYQAGVAGYMNPFVNQAMGATAAQIENMNAQQRQQLLGNQISSGAFGGDRAGIAQANLANQQNLAAGQTLSQMASQGYQNAAQNYLAGLGAQAGIAGQQGALYGQQGALANQYGQLGGAAQQALINAGQAQQAGAANLANIAGQQMGAAGQYGALGTNAQTAALQGVPLAASLGAQYGNLGAGAQTAGLAGAQAQLGAGTLGQQTQQAGQTALYNQFLQQQAYPFQTAQFLANIAEGTGALSGSTTTQTSPTSFFSDRRLKHDVERIGETDDGLPIYKFKYNGDDKTNIGFMADEVEKVHPEAVGESHGFKTVDYDRATRYAGGLVPSSEGGAVDFGHAGEGFAIGGDVASNPNDIAALLASQQQSYAPFQQGGLYGATAGSSPGGKGYVPANAVPVSHLAVASPLKSTEGDTLAGDLHNAASAGQDAQKLWNQGQQFKKFASDYAAEQNKKANSAATAQNAQRYDDVNQQGAYRGGLVHAYADGGDVEPYSTNDPMSDVVKSGEKKPAELKLMQSQPTSAGQGSSTLGDLSKMATMASDISTLGTMASDILPFIGLHTGGRAGFADGGDTADDPSGLDSHMQYKIAPQSVEDMDPVQQQVVKSIYQGESGGRYDILNGGEKFDPNGPHPHRVGKNGSSTAAGAGQFIGSTWDKVTGGAPMTPEYQDSATWKLANNDYNQRTGRNLHEDVAANGFSPEIKSALAPTWTSLANNANPKSSGFSLGSIFGINPANAQEQPQQGPKNLGDALTSEQFLVPLLSGLGAMAGSNSRYLGAALLQGIGAGANAYENVQNQMLERQALQPVVQQRQIETVNQLTGGWQSYVAQTGNRISLQDYANMVGYKGPIPSGSSTNQGTQLTSSLPQAFSLPEMQTAVVERNGVKIPAMNDPLSLQAAIQQYGTSVNAQVKNSVDNMRARLLEIENHGYTTDVNGNRINLPGSISAGQQGEFAKQQMDTSKEFVNNRVLFNTTSPATEKNLSDLEDVYSLFRSGPDAPARRAAQQLLGAIDPYHKVPEWHTNDASSFETAQKGAAALIAQQLATMPPGAPRAELEVLARQIAQPNLQPDAVHHIISRAKAALQYQKLMYNNYDPQKENFNVPDYQQRFMESLPFEKFSDQVEKQTKPAAGSASTGIVEGSETVSKSGKPIIYRNGQWEYK